MRHIEPEFTFSVPLRVKVSKKKYFILNLNNYRNAHHRVTNTAKRNFHDIVYNLGLPRVRYDKIHVRYKIYPPTNRLYDGNNVISIIDKFLMDALVNLSVVPDDNIKHVICPYWEHSGKDKDNPRVEVEVYNVD